MSFVTLYRKYRPQKFDDLVGQKQIVKTLINALKNDRIAHAYLFSGPRGTGKTSTAKVFAMALNCQDSSDIEPCGRCIPCNNIQKGQSIDVIEIDAASNRGIDEIRELREKVKFYPGEGQYKVYIIDEVHMLTRGAFNALLKTLEEPPENVVFILATTEPHKVISTILSRCQRFDFSLLSVTDIQKRLEYICHQEEVEYDKEALISLAHAANGGLRDAISLLDQAISYSDGKLTVVKVQKMLGKIDRELLNRILSFIREYDTAGVLKKVNEIIDEGISVARFVDDLTEHCRQLLLIKECGINAGIIELPEEVLKLMQKESKLFTSERLINFINILTGINRDIKFSNNPRQIMELGIIKMASEESGTESWQLLKDKVKKLEEKLNDIEINGQIKDGKEDIETNKVIDKANKKRDSKSKAEYQEQKSKSEKKKNTSDTGDEVELCIDLLRKKWPEILREVKKEDITTHALLIEGKTVAVDDDLVVIEFPSDKDFHKKNAEQKSGLINKIFNRVLDIPCQLQFDLAGGGKSKKKIEGNKKQDDIVDKIAGIFEGQVIEVDQEILENQGGFINEYE